ncbi:MAG: DUF1150 family protein [Paracoccaceae bacterium]|nr:hypothetical protein RB2150_07273 [Rhodobacterales bacterium HTCC2150] [Rhodobacteraceae bacterium HTCC2150]MDG1532373.1 DUF1150 family protein [Paracoccaceae bacterium]
METPYEFEEDGPDRIVYIRSVEVAELPEDLRDQAEGRDQIYAVHSEDGERLALVRDRAMAFALARSNDLAPVAVH